MFFNMRKIDSINWYFLTSEKKILRTVESFENLHGQTLVRKVSKYLNPFKHDWYFPQVLNKKLGEIIYNLWINKT